ncbi:hypothetical protein R1flu_018743 [Riccia fluitans]|uniref:Uncharacterized protein n=1 Tax=Riccia fluitans TaxID=41844 RepID=A0ABD1ZI46_9MARC
MKDVSTGLLVLRNVRALVAKGRHQPQTLASSVQFRRYANERAEDSSASNWGTGEPPIDEKMTERGVSRGQGTGMAQNTSTRGGSGAVGRHDEPTSTSEFDSGGTSSSSAGQPKKSRTGSEMAKWPRLVPLSRVLLAVIKCGVGSSQ